MTKESIRIVVRPPDVAPTFDRLLDIPLTVGGKAVPLSNVARIMKEMRPVVIVHADGRSVLEVLLDTGGKKTDTAVEIEKTIREEKLPADVSLELQRFFEGAGR